MLETIAIVFIVLWLLGIVSGITLGNFVWVFLIVGITLLVARLAMGERARF